MPGRTRSIHVGKLRHRITVQTAVETQDVAGQPVVEWQDMFANEPCDFRPMGGSESIRQREVQATFDALFTVRYRDGYNEQMRVVFQGKNYGIKAITKVDGVNRYLELSTVTA